MAIIDRGAGRTIPDEVLTPAVVERGVRGAGWFAATAMLLAGLAPVLLIATVPLGEHSSSAWVWAWLFAVVVGLRYAWLVGQGTRRLFELMFWLFTYVFMGLAPLVQMRSGSYPGTTPFIDRSLNDATMAIICVGTAAFCVGLVAGGHRWRSAGADSRVASTRLASTRAASTLVTTISTHRVVALTSVAMLLSVLYMSRLGLGTLFSTREQRTSAEGALWHDDATRAIIKAAATWPLVVGFIALRRLREQRAAVGRPGPAVLPWLALIVLAIVINPVSSPRYVVGTAALAVITSLGLTGTARRTRLLALALAAALVLVFPYADLTRKPNQSAADLSRGPVAALSSGDFDAFDQLNNTRAYVRTEGNTNGSQLAGAALFWVPRTLWNDKPRDTGIVLADYRGYSFHNLSAPIWAEFFIDGGWALLLLGMGLLGWGVRRLDEHALAATGALPGRGVLACIAPFYFFIMLRGSLLQSMAGLAAIAVSAAFVSRGVGAHGHRSVGAEGSCAAIPPPTLEPHAGNRPRSGTYQSMREGRCT